MMVTTGERVALSFGSATLSLSALISCSKLRVSTSAPKLAASIFAVSRSIAELMVIIIRRSSSAFKRVLDANLETIRQVLHRHAFGEGDGAGDRRRRRRRRGGLRTLERFALLRRLHAS